jgi:calcineurin-like phosphoesterase family protein
MQNIWFTSDTHYSHKNIVRGTTEWKEELPELGSHRLQSVRDFNTVEEHNEILVSNINALVKSDDILYHLGDWSFGGHEQIKLFRDKLNCKEIHLIFGNHDQHIKPIDSSYRTLFASCNDTLELKLKVDKKYGVVGKQIIFLSHYGHRVWNKSYHGAIHLFGHSHGTLPMFGKSMDVGVDTNNLYPYHLDEIMDIMSKVSVNIVDHHNQNTN